jgi:signal transduction histidine kinase
MNSLLRHILPLPLLIVACLTVKAAKWDYTAEKPLKFAIDFDYAPLEYVNDKSLPDGLDVEFTKIMLGRMGIPYEFRANTWENVADDVLNSRVDLAMMVYSPYRKDLTNYSRAVFRLYYQIISRKGETDFMGLRDVKNKTIAIMDSRPMKDTLTKSGAKVVVIKDLKKAVNELSHGDYDGVICFRYQANYLMEKFGSDNLVAEDLALMPREYCYVSPNKELIDSINVALRALEEEGVIEDVYGDVRSSFNRSYIPMWVRVLLGCVIVLGLAIMLVQQRINGKRLKQEMLRVQHNEKLKDVFLGNISHALRTPLNAIVGFTDLLVKESRDMSAEEREGLAKLVNKNSHQLSHLVNELTSIVDIEQNGLLFYRERTDILAEINGYVDELRSLLHEGVQVHVDPPVNGLTLLVDKTPMRLVTTHLLKNAMQHTTEGLITISFCVRDGGLYLEVRDTGSGISQDIKDNIFALLSDKNAYMQNDMPGLGLTVCKAVVDRFNGKIGVRDNDVEGRGTIFWYWVPLKK